MTENDMDLATLEAVRERLAAEQDINAATTVDGMISAARIAQAGSTEDSKFEFWWNDTGQYLRAGGGGYEKTFAYHAFKDGREELRAQLAAQQAAVPEYRRQPIDMDEDVRKRLTLIAREAAISSTHRYNYMPATPEDAQNWQPHAWVLDAMRMVELVEPAAPQQGAGMPEVIRSLLMRAVGQIEYLAESVENLAEDLEDDDVSGDIAEAREIAAELEQVARLNADRSAQGEKP